MNDLNYACPKCGKGPLNVNTALTPTPGTAVCCEGCQWRGELRDTLVAPSNAGHLAAVSDLIAKSRADFISKIGGSFHTAFLTWLIEWGFVDKNSPNFKEEATLYLKNATVAAYKSIIDTRHTLAKKVH